MPISEVLPALHRSERVAALGSGVFARNDQRGGSVEQDGVAVGAVFALKPRAQSGGVVGGGGVSCGGRRWRPAATPRGRCPRKPVPQPACGALSGCFQLRFPRISCVFVQQ